MLHHVMPALTSLLLLMILPSACGFTTTGGIISNTHFGITVGDQRHHGFIGGGKRLQPYLKSLTKVRAGNDKKVDGGEGGIGSFFEAGPKFTVPADIKKKLYEVESNTEAAQGRQTRVFGFGVLGAAGLLLTVANTALSTIAQANGGMLGADLSWTSGNPLLTSKWGGFLDILVAGLFGTLVELEYRTRDENVERIWQEMKRREAQGEEQANKRIRRMPVSTSKGGTSKKKSKKQQKRLAALAEVVGTDDKQIAEVNEELMATATPQQEADPPSSSKEEEEGGGLFGAAKRFYKQADEMAAAQALLLNKKLEEEGVVEKITDETGLRVVGKEAAAQSKNIKDAEKKRKPAAREGHSL
jgi:hypothetical protein